MTDFLIRKFIKNYDNTEKSDVRASYGLFSGIVGIICNAVLFIAKIIAGILAGSVSVIADAVNNLSDASSSVISLIGFKMAQRPADKEHPYGHGRYEYLAGMIVAVLIIVIGVELLREGVSKIIHPSDVNFTAISFAVLITSILIKLWMMAFNLRIGKKINSKTLLATAYDSRNDALSTFAVLAGAAAAKFFGLRIDGYLTAAVAVFVIISGIGTVRETLDPMLGRAPDKETVNKIRNKIMRYEGVLGAHDLMVHDYGALRQFASVHVEMSAEKGAIESHEIIDNIERDFLENDGIRMIVHFDPVPAKNSELGDLREWIAGEAARLDSRITIHDLRMSEDKIYLDCVIPQDMEIGDREVKQFISNIAEVKYPKRECEVKIDRSFAEIDD